MAKSLIFCDDSFKVLRRFPDRYFSVSCFSPPYGVNSFFDIRTDFDSPESKFLVYLEEITRVCRITAINFTQLLEGDKRNSLFIEKLIINAACMGINLYDRWVIEKPSVKPRRGERPLSGYEFVLLFLNPGMTEKDVVLNQDAFNFRTNIKASGHANYKKSDSFRYTGTTPYFPEIPKQVISIYGSGRVLDPFCGSGTTLVEALKLGKDCVGVDIIPEIVDFARNNCKQYETN